jgi:predicted nucleic acid-binding protein
MFLLDTNILSAVMGTRSAPQMASWMEEQPLDLLFTAAVCQAEILSGIAVLPKGRRRAALEMAALAMFREDFAGRILPFDSDAAVIYADRRPPQHRPPGGDSRSDDCLNCPRAWRHRRHARHGRFRGLRRGADQSVVGLMTGNWARCCCSAVAA